MADTNIRIPAIDIAREKYRNKKQKQKEHLLERIGDSMERTPQDQVRNLDLRLGKGSGAKRERERLNKMIQEGNGKKPMKNDQKQHIYDLWNSRI